jgi:hypothetical protein
MAGLTFGLMTDDYTPKPAFGARRDLIRSSPSFPAPELPDGYGVRVPIRANWTASRPGRPPPRCGGPQAASGCCPSFFQIRVTPG